MSWTKLDDGYDSHAKMLALGGGWKGDARRYVWTRILIYSNRHGSPVIPVGIEEAVARATPRFVNDCVEIGLADRQDDGTVIVHDWPLYADVTIEEKVAFALTKTPQASANELARQIGGKRQIVLHEIARQRPEGGSLPGSTEPLNPVPEVVPENRKSGSRARAPVPSRPERSKTSPPLTSHYVADERDDPDEPTNYNHALETLIEACSSDPSAREKLTADALAHHPPEARLVAIHWAITQNGTKDRTAKARSMIRRTSAGLATDQ